MTSPATVETSTRGYLARIGHALRAPLRITLDIALPPLCPACREPVGESLGLCAECWSKLSPIAPPYCARLGALLRAGANSVDVLVFARVVEAARTPI